MRLPDLTAWTASWASTTRDLYWLIQSIFHLLVVSQAHKMLILSIVCVNCSFEGWVIEYSFYAAVGNFHDVRHAAIDKRISCRTRDRARYIWNAIMQHAFLDIHRMFVCGWTRGFNTSTFINANVHDNRTRFHGTDHFACNQDWSALARIQHRPDHDVCI